MSINADTFSWQTPDGLNIHGLHWKQEKPKAVIGFVHGLGEHVARYDHIASAYAKAGLACMGYDRQGHGQSDGPRGHIVSYAAVIQEVKTLITHIRRVYGDTPVFLYGHSMGGNLVLYYLVNEEVNVDGVIASSPWIELAFKPSVIKVQGGKLMRSLLPKFSMNNDLDPNHISREPAEVQAYVNDPLVHSKITPNTGVFMLEKADFLNTYSGEISKPLLMIHGTGDQIISSEATRRFSERVNGPVSLQTWEGGYHELHHDLCQDEVIEYTLDWLLSQL